MRHFHSLTPSLPHSLTALLSPAVTLRVSVEIDRVFPPVRLLAVWSEARRLWQSGEPPLVVRADVSVSPVARRHQPLFPGQLWVGEPVVAGRPHIGIVPPLVV